MKKLIIATLLNLLLLGNYVAADHIITRLDPRGNDEYLLEFVNRQDMVYRLPYITNEGGTFKYGDNDKDLVFVEGNFSEGLTLEEARQEAIFNVGILDYAVLSNIDDPNGNDEDALTHIIRYNSIDTADHVISFDEEGSGTKEFIYEDLGGHPTGAIIGKAILNFSDNLYVAYIGNTTAAGNDNPLVVDMNGDGQINRAEIRATTFVGNILDFGNAEESDGGTFGFSGGQYTWSNSGDDIQNNVSIFGFLSKDRTIHHQPNQDELVRTIIEKRFGNGGDQIGIQSVTGSRFVLAPPNSAQESTYYGFLFDLFVSGVGNDAETLTIAYLRHHPRH